MGSRFLLASAVLFSILVIAGCGDEASDARAPAIRNDAPWPMHAIDSRFRGGNGIGAADVDGDGFTDYVTNYEFDQRYEIAFHPGVGADPRMRWPTVTAYVPGILEKPEDGVNPESADLGDVDGDGAIDLVAGQGWGELPFWEGDEAGIRIVWGPPPDRARDPGAWRDAGRIPATVDDGHFHWIRTHDVNGDGLADIVAGGRVHGGSAIDIGSDGSDLVGGSGKRAGVRWLEAPADPASRRDLSAWQMHLIDADQWSGHGFIFVDLDADGDDDIVLANADFDTPEEDESILWYENPGTGSPAQRAPWPMRVIERRSDFDGKPQVAAGDLDGDGDLDLVTATREEILLYRNSGTVPVSFELVTIVKDPRTRYFHRPIRIVDLDQDGRLDILGMLVHEDRTIPSEVAAAFWMEWSGEEPGPRGWTTHVIKWGAGQTMFLPTLGEKWDQVEFDDVDRDGDLDIVANCEEWWEDGGQIVNFWESPGLSTVAVVWFENRMFEPPYRFVEREGEARIEAELYTDAHDGSWLERGMNPGFGGHGYMVDHFALAGTPRAWDETRGLEYRVHVEGGDYALRVRRWVPSRWGTRGRGGAASDSAWIGIDDAPVGTVPPASAYDLWEWVPVGRVSLSEGEHTLQVRVREGGFALDALSLVADRTPDS